MGSRSASRLAVCVTRRMLYGFCFFALSASVLTGQTQRAPGELLKEAAAFHRAGQLEQAIEDYRLFLEKYPDVAPVRSDLGAALAAAGRYEEAIAEYKRALVSALVKRAIKIAMRRARGEQVEASHIYA